MNHVQFAWYSELMRDKKEKDDQLFNIALNDRDI